MKMRQHKTAAARPHERYVLGEKPLPVPISCDCGELKSYDPRPVFETGLSTTCTLCGTDMKKR